MVLKRRRIIERGTLQAIWRILCWRVGKAVAPPAFVIDCLLQSCLEIFDRPKEGDARRVCFFGNEFDPFLHEGKGVICHAGLRADGVIVRRS